MSKFKLLSASLASLTILALTPVAAHADACNQCYGGCVDSYGDDNSENGLYLLSLCVNSCTNEDGRLCSLTIPG